MSVPVDTNALRERLRRVLEFASAAGCGVAELVAVARAADAICAELERRRRRPSTEEQLELLRRLEPLLQGYEPGERIEILRRRLGVGRTRVYELLRNVQADRKFASSTEKWTAG